MDSLVRHRRAISLRADLSRMSAIEFGATGPTQVSGAGGD
jgi:hypothetical protein